MMRQETAAFIIRDVMVLIGSISGSTATSMRMRESIDRFKGSKIIEIILIAIIPFAPDDAKLVIIAPNTINPCS